MKLPLLLSLAGLTGIVGLVACQSQGSSKDAMEVEVECVCGTSDGDLYGCYHAECVSQEGNPDNPLCVCNSLALEGAEVTQVGYGKSAPSSRLGQMTYVYVNSGGYRKGVLKADDALSVQLQTDSGELLTIAYDDIAPRSVYQLMRSRTPDDDAAGQIEVANYARDNGLYAYAKKHYVAAMQADPGLEEEIAADMTVLRERAADAELAKAADASSKGMDDQAEKHLTAILTDFPHTAAAETATTMLAQVEKAAHDQRSRSVADSSGQVAKALEPAKSDYDRAVDLNHEGLTARSQSKGSKSFEASVKSGERARTRIASVLKKNGDDSALAAAADKLDGLVVEQMVTSYLNLSSLYLTRGSHQKALGAVNDALALDPKNRQALSMRSNVEMAANQGIFGGWGGWGPVNPRPGRG